MSLPSVLRDKLRLPAIGAPLFIISHPALVIAQCKAGIVGSFPALNARPISQLDEWLHEIVEALAAHDRAHPDKPAAPFAVACVTNGQELARPCWASGSEFAARRHGTAVHAGHRCGAPRPPRRPSTKALAGTMLPVEHRFLRPQSRWPRSGGRCCWTCAATSPASSTAPTASYSSMHWAT